MAKFHVDLQMRWGDQDAYGHINNVSQARYFEEARVRTFFSGSTRENTGMAGIIRTDKPDGLKMVVASQTLTFLKALEYSPEPLVIEMWIDSLGGSSLEIHAQLLAPGPEKKVTTKCVMTAVVVDGKTMQPRRLQPEIREIAKSWMG